MNKIKVWLDNTMARRLSIKWVLIYSAIILGSIGGIIRFCSVPYTMVFTKYGILVYNGVIFIPVFVIGIIYSAYQLADEIRFLKGEES